MSLNLVYVKVTFMGTFPDTSQRQVVFRHNDGIMTVAKALYDVLSTLSVVTFELDSSGRPDWKPFRQCVT